MQSKLNPLFIAALLLTFAKCTQVDVSGLNPDLFKNSGKGGGNTSELCNGVDSKFSTDVLPIFHAKCAGGNCHVDGVSGGGLNLDDQDDTLGDGPSGVIGNIKSNADLSLSTPSQSKLLLVPLATAEGGSGATHPGGEIFKTTNDADYKKIFCWIDSGAVNDLDSSLCTFGEHVYPIFTNRGCTGGTCHSASNHGGNMNLAQDSVSLSSDSGDRSFDDACTGSIVGSTCNDLSGKPSQPVVVAGDATSSLLLQYPVGQHNHTGASPLGSTTDPDYQTIKCWIDEGAKTN